MFLHKYICTYTHKYILYMQCMYNALSLFIPITISLQFLAAPSDNLLNWFVEIVSSLLVG